MDNKSDNQENEQEELNEAEESYDEIVPEEDSGNLEEKLKKLKQSLKKCESEKRQYLEGWQRTKADFINTRKNQENEKVSFVKFANQNLIAQIISSLDNFQAAFNDTNWKKMPEEWRMGIENAYRELEKVLLQQGLEEINPNPDSDFDPKVHEAISAEEVDSPKLDQKIKRTVQTGYMMSGKVIRAAKVVVGSYKG